MISSFLRLTHVINIPPNGRLEGSTVSWVLEKDGRQTMVIIQGKAEGPAISILNDKL